MITNICLLLEALSVVLCVHYLYGEKFKLDIATVSYLSIYMIIVVGINYYNLPQIYTMITYPIMFLYCGVRFGFKIKAMIVNNMLFLAITGGIQFIVLSVCSIIYKIESFENIMLLVVNCITFVIILFVLPKCRLNQISIYFQDKERIYVTALIISISATGYWLIQYKKIDGVGVFQSVLVFAGIAFIGFLIIQLGKYKINAKEIETELKMQKLFADSFQGLIENIRMKQHEFDNHINTIYSQHYMYDNYEDLVNAQKEYCHAIEQENHYNKLLRKGNPAVLGFIYFKFLELERDGIEIGYKIHIRELEIGVPVHKIIEILGNLIKNAAEALRQRDKDRRFFIQMIETEDGFDMEVRNISDDIPLEELGRFFNKGYSSKGNERGLGLYHVKKICDEYKLNIQCANKSVDGENWLSFIITNRKE